VGGFINMAAHVNYPEDEGIVQVHGSPAIFALRPTFASPHAHTACGYLDVQDNGGSTLRLTDFVTKEPAVTLVFLISQLLSLERRAGSIAGLDSVRGFSRRKSQYFQQNQSRSSLGGGGVVRVAANTPKPIPFDEAAPVKVQ
jgi:hypothetical protein